MPIDKMVYETYNYFHFMLTYNPVIGAYTLNNGRPVIWENNGHYGLFTVPQTKDWPSLDKTVGILVDDLTSIVNKYNHKKIYHNKDKTTFFMVPTLFVLHISHNDPVNPMYSIRFSDTRLRSIIVPSFDDTAIPEIKTLISSLQKKSLLHVR